MWYPGSGVVFDVSIPDLCHLSYFQYRRSTVIGGKKQIVGLIFKYIYSYSHLHSNIQIYSLQYNHDGIQKKSQTTYKNMFPFKEEGA